MAGRIFKNRIKELNKWRATNDLTQVTFDMGYEAALTWELPPSYVCVVRALLPNGKVSERSYRNGIAAKRYMTKLLEEGNDYMVMTSNEILDTLDFIP